MFILRPFGTLPSSNDILVQYRERTLKLAAHNVRDWLTTLHDSIHENSTVPEWLRELSKIWQPYRERTTRLQGSQIIDVDALLPTESHHADFATAVQEYADTVTREIRSHQRKRSGLRAKEGEYLSVLGWWLTMQQTTILMQALLDETLHPAFAAHGEGITAAILLSLVQCRRDGQLGYGIIQLPTTGSIGGTSYWIHPDNQQISIQPPTYGSSPNVMGAPELLFFTAFSDEPNDADRYNTALRQGVKEVWHLAFHHNQIWLYTAPDTAPIVFPSTERIFSASMNDYLDLSRVFELALTTFHWLLTFGEE